MVSPVLVKELGESLMGPSHLTQPLRILDPGTAGSNDLDTIVWFFVTYNSTNTIKFQRLTSPQMPHPTEVTGRFSNNRNNKH